MLAAISLTVDIMVLCVAIAIGIGYLEIRRKPW